MSVQVSKRLINVSEYYRMAEAGILTENDRVELIHGEIIEMSPVGSKHAATVDRINKMLNDLQLNAIVRVQSPVKIDELSEPEPDIVLLKSREDFYEERHPQANDILLIIEVADTTKAYDQEIKIPLYAQAGIPEAWLIDLNSSELAVYTNPSADGYKKIELFNPNDKVRLQAFGIELEAGRFLGRKV